MIGSRHTHRRRQLVSWLAVFALWCQAVLPIYGMALASPAAGFAVPVCTGAGIVWQVPGAAAPAGKSDGKSAAAFCPYCVVATASFVAPDAPAPARAIALAQPIDPAVHRDSIVAPRRHTPHISRAPPASA